MKAIYTIADLFDSEVYKTEHELQAVSRNYFRIAGITVCLESDQDLDQAGFKEELKVFAVDLPGEVNVTLRHHFEMPDIRNIDLGKELYNNPPWAISFKDKIWCYKGIMLDQDDDTLHQLVFFNADYSKGVIYTPPRVKEVIKKIGWQSLSLMPTDQIWLIPVLADYSALLIHSAAAILNRQGLIFVGHSEAGKSTTVELLMAASCKEGLEAEILCDDRNIIRCWPDGWRVHGTWSHGDIMEVSSSGAPLRAVLFLEQATKNEIKLVDDRKLLWKRLLATLVRPMVTEDWWQKELDILEKLVEEVPCYNMYFDKSGAIVQELGRLTI